LSRRGEVKLSDFGIARWQHRTEPTLAGVARGKPSYMAPEQATKGDLDGRADVFSLGCTLHVLITRTSPLGDENALVDLLAGVPLELSPALPPAVGALVARAVQRDRNARFSTALAFAEACEAVVEALAPGYPFEATLSAMVAACAPPPAAPPIAGPPRVPAMRRRVWPLAVVAAALAAGLVGLALSLSRPPQVQAPADDLVFAPLDADRTAVVTRPVAVAPEVSPAPAPMPVTPKPPAPAAPQPPRAPPRTGVIAVGGERFLRAEVFVDGRSVGFAPQQLEVSVGLHPVELVLPGGERVGPRVLAVGAQHTEVSPLRWVE
ncbi:MAG: protein kinase, partial [Myxococcaceae bacterium]|nr:protein kinase [Myxococcaceae bacterium]